MKELRVVGLAVAFGQRAANGRVDDRKVMSAKYKHPAPFLSGLIDKPIVVRLKWGMEYVGVLVSFDQRMNLQLKDAQEFVNGEMQADIGTLCLRCNNILYVREKPSVYPVAPVPDDAIADDE